MPGRPSGWWPLVAPLAVLFLLSPSVLGYRILAGGDHLVYWYPLMQFFRDHWLADGVVPFWIPNLFAGMPLPESLGPSFFYPTDPVCWAGGIPVRLFYAGDALLHLVLAAAGMRVLARRLGARDAAAALAACAYVFGGYLQVQLGAGTHVFLRAAGWLPWVFLLLTGERDAAPRLRVVPLAMLWALLALTQAFQTLASLAVVLPVYLAVSAAVNRPETSWSRLARAGILALLGAAVLAAVVWIPAGAYYRHSFRHLTSETWTHMEYLRWPQVVALVVPDLTTEGDRAKALGLVPLLGAAVACVAHRRRAAPWLAVAAVALVLALGPQTPAGDWLGRLPLFRSFRVSSHWIVFVQLAVSILAGLGLEAACAAAAGRRRVPAWALPAVLILLTLADARRAGRPHPRQVAPAGVGGGPASPLTLLARESREPFRIHSEEVHVLLNTRLAEPLEWTAGYHGAVLEGFGRFYDAATACGRIEEAMAVLGARYFVTKAPATSVGLVTVRPFTGQDGAIWWLSRCDRSLPRVFVPREVRPDPDGAQALARLCAGQLATTDLAWVQTGLPDLPRRGATGARVRWAGSTPNAVDADAELRSRSLVVFSEVAYPAWKGFIDGRRAPVLRADYLLRAVVVPTGRHRIRLVYDSLWFKLGLWLSLLGWAALATACMPGRGTPEPGYTESPP